MTNHYELAKAEDEAAGWVLLLAEDPSNQVRQQFNEWLATSPVHAQVWDRTQWIFRALEQIPPPTQQQWPDRLPGQ